MTEKAANARADNGHADNGDELDNIIQEEYWPAMDPFSTEGAFSLRTQHEIHAIDFGLGQSLRYKSISGGAMTPLDMNFSRKNIGSPQVEEEFYDGTGNLMWLAAVCWAHLLAAKVERLRRFLPPNNSSSRMARICELGCGTGGGGIALALFHFMNDGKHKNVPNAFHVTFTDNDNESLELCRYNCELNGMIPKTYSQRLLSWGGNNLPKEMKPHSFDFVLATDVVYDLKMIRPLMETASDLLMKDKGNFILSHVPRFCLPRKTTRDSSEITTDNGTGSYEALEHHIIDTAESFGLILVDRIRPHEELEGILPSHVNHQVSSMGNNADSFHQVTVQDMNEAHAVVFVFVAS
jgi:hypothetical protein